MRNDPQHLFRCGFPAVPVCRRLRSQQSLREQLQRGDPRREPTARHLGDGRLPGVHGDGASSAHRLRCFKSPSAFVDDRRRGRTARAHGCGRRPRSLHSRSAQQVRRRVRTVCAPQHRRVFCGEEYLPILEGGSGEGDGPLGVAAPPAAETVGSRAERTLGPPRTASNGSNLVFKEPIGLARIRA